MPLILATPGVPMSAPKSGGTFGGISFAHGLGIRAMEMEWVQAVPKNMDNAKHIREVSTKLNFALTVHAPYFVNLNSKDKTKLEASKRRILDALTMAEICGALSVCVHPAFYGGEDPAIALVNVRKATADIMKHKAKLFPHVNLAYETMGKVSQFGTLEEVLQISKEFDIYPCIDPAHMHARSNGKWNTAKEWNTMLDVYEKYLGKKSLKSMHMHFSGIAYGEKGEKHHEPLEESDAKWKDFLKVLKDRKVEGVLVCESPLMEQDTLLMQAYFAGLKE